MPSTPIETLYQAYLDSSGVCTDTRKIEKGNVFFALKGGNFNGNLYAEQALEKGASTVVVDEEEVVKGNQYLLVDDVLKALQELAKHHRRELNIPIFALTGSNGKTTTKELIKAVLTKKYNVISTSGNLNNHIGVPLTLLAMDKNTEIGIVEMGANKPGDIKELCEIAEPTYGMITNIGKAHLEGFGGYEGVIRTKSEMYDFLLDTKGQVIVNGEDELLKKQSSGFKNRLFYLGDTPFYTAEYLGSSPYVELKAENGDVVQTQMIGRYNFENMVAALCVGKLFDVDAQLANQGLKEYCPSNNRSQIVKKNGTTFILDAYNANPSSMESSLKNFAEMEANKKAVVLGDMLELGEASEEEHMSIANLVKKIGVEKGFFFGEEFLKCSSEFDFEFYTDKKRLQSAFMQNDWNDALILVKGSRGMKLEELIEDF